LRELNAEELRLQLLSRMEQLALRVSGAALAALWSPSSPLAAPRDAAALAAAAAAWVALVAAALWLLGALVLRLGGLLRGGGAAAAPLRDTGKPLAALAPQDEAFIAVNKLATAVFSFHLVRYCCLGVASLDGGAAARAQAPLAAAFAPAPLRWAQAAVSAADLAPLLGGGAAPASAGAAAWAALLLSPLYGAACVALLFVVYDCAYAPFHLALHHRSVYALVHKWVRGEMERGERERAACACAAGPRVLNRLYPSARCPRPTSAPARRAGTTTAARRRTAETSTPSTCTRSSSRSGSTTTCSRCTPWRACFPRSACRRCTRRRRRSLSLSAGFSRRVRGVAPPRTRICCARCSRTFPRAFC
jgi:hypothetical protein